MWSIPAAISISIFDRCETALVLIPSSQLKGPDNFQQKNTKRVIVFVNFVSYLFLKQIFGTVGNSAKTDVSMYH